MTPYAFRVSSSLVIGRKTPTDLLTLTRQRRWRRKIFSGLSFCLPRLGSSPSPLLQISVEIFGVSRGTALSSKRMAIRIVFILAPIPVSRKVYVPVPINRHCHHLKVGDPGAKGIPEGMRKIITDGFTLTHTPLLAHFPIPPPKDEIQGRSLCLALESLFHCIFWSLRSREPHYGYFDDLFGRAKRSRRTTTPSSMAPKEEAAASMSPATPVSMYAMTSALKPVSILSFVTKTKTGKELTRWGPCAGPEQAEKRRGQQRSASQQPKHPPLDSIAVTV